MSTGVNDESGETAIHKKPQLVLSLMHHFKLDLSNKLICISFWFIRDTKHCPWRKKGPVITLSILVALQWSPSSVDKSAVKCSHLNSSLSGPGGQSLLSASQSGLPFLLHLHCPSGNCGSYYSAFYTVYAATTTKIRRKRPLPQCRLGAVDSICPSPVALAVLQFCPANSTESSKQDCDLSATKSKFVCPNVWINRECMAQCVK